VRGNLFLNEGCREIALAKPNATEETIAINMVAGADQSLPSTHAAILRAIKNATGELLTSVSRTVLDLTVPGWQDANIVRQAAVVDHLVYDKASPREFLVYPPNDGTGVIHVVASKIPTTLADGSTANDVTTYTLAVADIPNIYQTALLNYVLFKAFSLDMNVPGPAQRAVQHMNLFNGALGVKLKAEIAVNPRTAAQQGD